MLMSSYIKLQDGTEFSVRCAISGRPVIYGFQESELEKLLTLKPEDIVEFDGKEKMYRDVKAMLECHGSIAAYLPHASDYLNVCNYL